VDYILLYKESTPIALYRAYGAYLKDGKDGLLGKPIRETENFILIDVKNGRYTW
jgi:hypothetical protein